MSWVMPPGMALRARSARAAEAGCFAQYSSRIVMRCLPSLMAVAGTMNPEGLMAVAGTHPERLMAVAGTHPEGLMAVAGTMAEKLMAVAGTHAVRWMAAARMMVAEGLVPVEETMVAVETASAAEARRMRRRDDHR